MATFEHDTSIGTWFFKALVESSKLRLMTYNEEAAHRNKPNARVQQDSRWTGGVADAYDVHDAGHVLILQGAHFVADEAATPQDVIHAYVPYPTGAGLAPYLRRPVPMVGGFRALLKVFIPGDMLGYQTYDPRPLLFYAMNDTHPSNSSFAMPETSVGVIGIDAGTDFTTSLVIAHRWSNNDSGAGIGAVYHGGYLFWRTIGHVAAY